MKENKSGKKSPPPSFLSPKSSVKPKPSSLASFLARSKAISKENVKIFKPAIQEIIKLFASSMQAYTNINISGELSSLTEIEFAKLKTTIKANDYFALFDSTALGSYAFFIIEESLIDLFVSAFYGAAKPTKTVRSYANLSAGEQEIAIIICDKFAEAINKRLSRHNTVFMEFNKSVLGNELNERHLEHEKLYDFSISLNFPGVTGKIHMFIPDRNYRPLYELMAETLNTKPNISDESWNSSLAKEVSNTELTLQAYITQGAVSLYKLSQLKPGQILPLPSGAFSNINIQSSNKRLYRGSLGKMGTHLSVKIDEFITDGAEG